MPSRGFYQVANYEEGKLAERDQSYRSCVLSLVIFFFLCIILILACLPWKRTSQPMYNAHTTEADESMKVGARRSERIKDNRQLFDFGSNNTTSSEVSEELSTTMKFTNKPDGTLGSTNVLNKTLKYTNELNTTMQSTEKPRITVQFTKESDANVRLTKSSTTTPNLLVTTTQESVLINYTVTSIDDTSGIEEKVTNTHTTTQFTEKPRTAMQFTKEPHTTASFTKNPHTTVQFRDETRTTVSFTEDPLTSVQFTGEPRAFVEFTEESRTTVPFTKESDTNVQFTKSSTTISNLLEKNTQESVLINYTTTSIYDTSGIEEKVTITEGLTQKQSSNESSLLTSASIIAHSVSTTTNDYTRLIEGFNATSNTATSKSFPVGRKNYSTEDLSVFTTNAIGNETENDTTQSPFTKLNYSNTSTEEYISDMYETPTASNNKDFITENKETSTTDSMFTQIFKDNITTTSSTYKTTQEESAETFTSTFDFSTTTSKISINENTCYTPQCKQLASKMLFFMNHTADPCDDFYEYACGGFEASPQTVEEDLGHIAVQRIARQMEKKDPKDAADLFRTYYESCMEYETISFAERVGAARELLDSIGKFYTTASWDTNNVSFTDLFAKLLLHHSPLLFDVTLDLDEFLSKQFTLKIGPTPDESIFDVEDTNDPCYTRTQFEREQETVDLNDLYEKYKSCKNDTSRFISSIPEALTALDVFNELNATYNVSQYIHITTNNIDFEIVQNFYGNFPSKDKIREAYLMKDYKYISIKELNENYKLINWTQLISSLTKMSVLQEGRVQVYFYDALDKGLKSLEYFQERNPMELNNALLGLYARNLYNELIISKHWNTENCLRVATSLLVPEASNLYISSFSQDELTHMNETIYRIFESLKDTLKIKINEEQWTEGHGRLALLNKINSLKLATPDISYLTTKNSTYEKYNASKINLSDNFFVNSIILMRRYRTLIYAQLCTNPGHPEQIWTHYATPFQSKGLAVYALNLVVIPFGAVDWTTKYNGSFDYLLLGTVGNTIAFQIAHHFDASGIYHWNGTRCNKTLLFTEDDSISLTYDDYIKCQGRYFQQKSIILPSTGQNVSYEMPSLTLNERLSEAMGLRLAYDTLDRLRSRNEIILPWLELSSDQLYYIAYAQMHCTKSPLTSSYISLYENEHLPSRIRIFVSALHNSLLGKAWSCKDGSLIMPSYTCTVFPYLPFDDTTVSPE